MNARAHLSPRRLPVIWGLACALGLAAAASRAGGDEADAAQPAAPTALSCGGDIIPILKAVDDLQRERRESEAKAVLSSPRSRRRKGNKRKVCRINAADLFFVRGGGSELIIHKARFIHYKK